MWWRWGPCHLATDSDLVVVVFPDFISLLAHRFTLGNHLAVGWPDHKNYRRGNSLVDADQRFWHHSSWSWFIIKKSKCYWEICKSAVINKATVLLLFPVVSDSICGRDFEFLRGTVRSGPESLQLILQRCTPLHNLQFMVERPTLMLLVSAQNSLHGSREQATTTLLCIHTCENVELCQIFNWTLYKYSAVSHIWSICPSTRPCRRWSSTMQRPRSPIRMELVTQTLNQGSMWQKTSVAHSGTAIRLWWEWMTCIIICIWEE